ncbi:hypothetical protein MKX01_042279 [Papaver californicum]|nr:hypothetical protein MKX01_042279 [Papaver californicum]
MTPLVLPEDVIFQTLIWLPLQSLLRFKSVCRSWYALIKSSHFIGHHTTTTVDNKNSSRLGGTFICQYGTQILHLRFICFLKKEASRSWRILANDHFLPFDCLREVQIYCLSTDSWRLIDSYFYIHCCSPAFGRSLNGIYFHQAVDYIVECHERVILSFDLSKEKYQRGMWCIFKVWMLNDYNRVKELWTELYIVDLTSPGWYEFGGIIGISRNGKFGILVQSNTLVCYNSITDEFEDLGFGEGINLYYVKANIYKESLVSVDANDSATKAISS